MVSVKQNTGCNFKTCLTRQMLGLSTSPTRQWLQIFKSSRKVLLLAF